MKYLLPFSVFLLYAQLSFAQKSDSIFVSPNNDSWLIQHTVKPKETVFLLARRYHVPPAIFTDANGLDYQSQLKNGSTVNIPVGAYNFVKDKPVQLLEEQPLFYKVQAHENLYRISRYSNVQQRALQDWNNLPDNSVQEGQILLVGWILYDATQIAAGQAPSVWNDNGAAQPLVNTNNNIDTNFAQADTAKPLAETKTPASTEMDEYNTQTANGANVITERGPAVFFDIHSNHAGAMYYAFHNITPRGTIIKVHNPGNGKTIYVKVLGALPETKLYANSIIGISGTAKAALGIADNKAWCELTFGGI